METRRLVGARGWIRLRAPRLRVAPRRQPTPPHPHLAPGASPSPVPRPPPRRPSGRPSPTAGAYRPATRQGSPGPTPWGTPAPPSWGPGSRRGSTPSAGAAAVRRGSGPWPSPCKCPPEPHGGSAQRGWGAGGFLGARVALSPRECLGAQPRAPRGAAGGGGGGV